ncbi:MAG: hypothetical protein ABJK28_11675 [Algibacter sp.]
MIKILNIVVVSFLMITTSLLQSQESPSDPEKKASLPRIEKIYLHTDRTCYTLGESLWYKAYSVYAYTNLLFDNSNVLYVELVDSDSKIISRNKTRLEGGLGHGDFKLKDSIGVKAGVYQIRAYTNFNRNFEDDFVFRKEIEIIDVFDGTVGKASGTSPKTVINKLIKRTEKMFKTQFFPEGGSLVNNIQSVVAFKSVDNNGNPISVQGKIFDSSGELITFFGSLHDGMGKFQLKPVKGEQYYAEITFNDNQIKVPIPNAEDRGYILSFKKVKGNDILSIKTNQETLSQQTDNQVILVCKTRGVTYFKGANVLTETTLSFELPKTDFPEGISQITLYDANLKPQSERLVFIEKENDLQVTLSTDKKIYTPSEKVTVNVTSKTKTDDAVPASFSLSCIDANGVENAKDYGTSISSYFLMESDIRGKVHNPGYYFDDSNRMKSEHLDLLLLTQGWRDFLWKKLPKVDENLTYELEKGLTISGTIKQLFGEKPKPNNAVNLTLFGKGGMKSFNTITDSKGRFEFDPMVFTGKTSMYLNTKNKKGKGTGRIELDALSEPPMLVDFKPNSMGVTQDISVLKEAVFKKYTLNGVAPDNILDAVEVTAKKKDYRSAYGLVDFVYEADDEESSPHTDIYQLIQSEIPGVELVYSEEDGSAALKFPRFGGFAAVFIDEVQSLYPATDLEAIQPDEVAKINAYQSQTTMFGSEGANGVISIYLKEGGSFGGAKKVFNSIKEKTEGFYDARIFYSTDPNSPSFENDNKLAVRNTLYWNPYIHPDKTGNYQVSYYNSEVQTDVKLTLEGITATGIPVVVKTNYTIEK